MLFQRFCHGLIILSVSCLAITCVGTEVGNPHDGDRAEISLAFQGVERTSPAALTLDNGIEFSEIWLLFRGVEFRRGADCDEEAEAGFNRVNAIELVSGDQFPGYELSTVDPGDYCEVDAGIEAVDAGELPEGVPEELAQISILIRGERADGTPFELRSDSGEGMTLEGEFALEAGRENLFLAFAVNEWLTPEQLDAAEGNTMIMINEEENEELLSDFLDRLESTALLIRDADGDGVIQDSELANPLAPSEIDEEEEPEEE